MPYNFYLDEKKDVIIIPHTGSLVNCQQPIGDVVVSEAKHSPEIEEGTGNITKSAAKNLESKENIENYNIHPQLQNQKNMDSTNENFGRNFFNPQAPQEQSQKAMTNPLNSYSQHYPLSGDPTNRENQNRGNNSDTKLNDQDDTNISDNNSDNIYEEQYSELNNPKTLKSETEDMNSEDHAPSKSEIWNMFQQNLKDKDSFYRQKNYPRKPLMVDPDLYSTLREIDIDNIAPTNLLNVILRTFIESFKEELRQYRKMQAPSVF